MTTELTQSERAAYIDQLAGTIEYSVWDDDRWSIISDHALITMMEMLLEREASEPEYLAWLAAHSGMTIDEVRRLDDEERVELQLTAEAAEAAKTAEMSTWPAAPVTPVPAVGYQPLELVCADDIEDTIPTWAWGFDGHGRILNAALTLFGGRPEAGKSTTGRWFAAGWTNGTLPGCFEGHPINVAYVATEEAWHHTVKPSLRAADADMKRVFFIRRGGNPARINSLQDEAELIQLFRDKNIRAVFLDPLMGTLNGGVDINRNNEVRDYLDPWVRIAEAIDGPVIGICHLTKAPRGDVVASITGSSAFGELARSVFAFAVDREVDDGTRIMSQVKNSSGHGGLNLAYKIGSHRVTTSDGKTAEMARFDLIGPSDKSVRDIILEENNSKSSDSGASKCAKWLRGYLTQHGPMLRADVMAEAREMGFSPKMLRTARLHLELEIERTREVPPRALWALPPRDGDNIPRAPGARLAKPSVPS